MLPRNRTVAVGLAALAAVLVLAGVACLVRTRPPATTTTPPTTSREHGVAEHSKDVMPFDLTRATHTFEPTSDGLVETVTTTPASDAEQVALIRGHLAAEATKFSAGDWSDPATIHGDGMPGLAQLRAAAPGALTIVFSEVDGGGRITYSTADPALVDALHRWGSAQSADHGHHGHGG